MRAHLTPGRMRPDGEYRRPPVLSRHELRQIVADMLG